MINDIRIIVAIISIAVILLGDRVYLERRQENVTTLVMDLERRVDLLEQRQKGSN